MCRTVVTPTVDGALMCTNGVDIDITKFGSLPSLQQAIYEVQWPASLRKLEFGYKFNQPIHEVVS